MPPQVTQPLETLLGWVLWLVCLAGIARLTWIGGEMGWYKKDPTGQPPETPVPVLVGLSIGSSAAAIAAALLTF